MEEKRSLVEQARKKVGEKVKLAGWVQVFRNQSSIKFIVLRDISGTVQLVITKEASAAFEEANALTVESVIEIVGLAKEEKQAPGGVEILVESLKILSLADAQLPIPVIEKGEQEEAAQEKRMDWRWIDLRKQERALTFKAWTAMAQGMREMCLEDGCLELNSPKLMSTASESGAEVFEVKYFERKAYLAQSPQFYKQMAMAAGFERVFEVGPVFRAEPSFTSRHATEFTGFDAEISFVDSYQDVISFLEKVVRRGIEVVKKEYGEQIKENFGREVVVPELGFPQVTLEEAKKMLAVAGVESEKAGDLNPEEERKLCELIKEKEGHEFVFVTEYPKDNRAFYHMRFEDRPQITRGFDLLWNGIEIATGAQREHRYEVLKQQALDKGMSLEALEGYLNFFKFGCPPHGGFGLGPGRMLMKLLDLPSIREASYLYRGVKRLTP